MGKNIVLVVDNIERARFFIRFECFFKLKGLNSIYITSSFLAHRFLQSKGVYSVHLGESKAREKIITKNVNYDMSSCVQVFTGVLSETKAHRLHNLYLYSLRDLLKGIECMFLCWNGGHLISKVVKDYLSIEKRHSIRFVELSNFPNKIFVDPEGVNAESSLAKNVEILGFFPQVDEVFHQNWLAECRALKRKPIGQSINLIKIPFADFLEELYGEIIGYHSAISLMHMISIKRVVEKLSRRIDLQKEYDFLDVKELPNGFIFYPMQVSSDTQIIINGDGYDNFTAIDYCLEKAREEALVVVVKPHPAEKNKEFVRAVLAKYKDKVLFCEGDTYEVIDLCGAVVTINSTVGLEAMLAGKKVTALGKCLYKDFDNETLKKYIHGYLVNGIDYFREGDIPPEVAERVVL